MPPTHSDEASVNTFTIRRTSAGSGASKLTLVATTAIIVLVLVDVAGVIQT